MDDLGMTRAYLAGTWPKQLEMRFTYATGRRYRLFHRVTREFKDVTAPSAQEACLSAGWMIGEVWVREESVGTHANGWRNITRRDVS